MDENDPGHGNSPAAWTAVVIMLLGFSAGTVGLFVGEDLVVWIGVGVIVVGIILGLVLSKLGYGVKGPRYTPKARH